MDRSDDTLLAELRALRPKPRPEFTAELDERAAAGFPRGASTSASAMPFAKLADWWRAATPTRRLAPVFAVLVIGLVTATAVIATNGGRSGDSPVHVHGPLMETDEAGGTRLSEEDAESSGEAAIEEAGESSGAAGGAEAGEAVEEGASEAEEEPEAEASEHGSAVSGPAVPSAAPPAVEAAPELKAQKATTAGRRDIERSAYVVLGTKPGEVSAASARVYEAVHAAHGIVLRSSVQSGKRGATGASFDLLIPSRKLDDTLAAFSQIAEVRERHDATNDITAPTVGAAEELADSNAAIDGLLKELGDAETEDERESVEARLHEERRRHVAIRAALDHLHERSSMSEVSVRIVTGHGAGVVPTGKDDDGWGVGDALGDAGDILTIAAGVALIALAVLGPIALIAILLWGGNRFRVRRLRERTLG